jgi:DNA-binding MarR family transcriptional regulator
MIRTLDIIIFILMTEIFVYQNKKGGSLLSDNPKTPNQPLEQFPFLMRGLGNRMIQYQNNVASTLGLYNSDHISLDLLREKGPITAGDLSKLTGLSTGSITALIDRLEKIGYASRKSDPSDRRKVIIVPDYEEKEEVINTYLPLKKAIMELAQSYTESELELIVNFLGKANTVLEEEILNLSSKMNDKK